jgi:hypothetical protein
MKVRSLAFEEIYIVIFHVENHENLRTWHDFCDFCVLWYWKKIFYPHLLLRKFLRNSGRKREFSLAICREENRGNLMALQGICVHWHWMEFLIGNFSWGRSRESWWLKGSLCSLVFIEILYWQLFEEEHETQCRRERILSTMLFGLSRWLNTFYGIHYHILRSQILDSPTFESQVLIFVPPGNRVAQLWFLIRSTVSRLVCLGIGHPYAAHDHIRIAVWHLRSSSDIPVCSSGATVDVLLSRADEQPTTRAR